jgi:hypothetical protein
MKNQLLLPNRFKKWGWALLIPAIILGAISLANSYEWLPLHVTIPTLINEELMEPTRYFSMTYTNMTNTLIGLLFIAGALLVSFSKEKNEDEFIQSLRLSSLSWAVLVNYLLLAFAFFFIYGMAFLQVMIYNMFTTLIIYIVRFNYVLYRNSKTAA